MQQSMILVLDYPILAIIGRTGCTARRMRASARAPRILAQVARTAVAATCDTRHHRHDAVLYGRSNKGNGARSDGLA